MPARTIYLIKRLETEVTTRMIEVLGAYKITPAQFTILSFVGDSETDLSSAQLSRRFLMTPQAMNEVVSTMQRKALIEKKTDPNHKRILRIRLTEEGQNILQQCNVAIDIMEEKLLSGLSAENLDLFRSFIGNILAQKSGA
ncbi:MAG: MarR family transcriptional regulator [Saprospiraceae bacterium]|nr:MarR family transcriptional regulator [Saprospiraceae bacterium]